VKDAIKPDAQPRGFDLPTIVHWGASRDELLSDGQASFLANMDIALSRGRRISERQEEWIRDIHDRLRGGR
jgi:hypothetical protein